MTLSAAKPLSDAAKRGVLAATVLGSSLAFIDSSVVNVALSALQADLDASTGELQWIVNAYLLMLGSLVLIGGSAADRYGRRRVFVIGVTLFALGSLACGLAPNAAGLVAARAVQGMAAAFAMPASLALLGASFGEGERSRAIGIWAGAGALTTALGPVLGGWLVDVVSWRAIFLVNLPVAAAAVVIALRWAPESGDPKTGRLDIMGTAAAVAGLGAVTWGLTAAPDRGVADAFVLAALGGGVLLLAGFVWIEHRAASPMMPLSLYRSAAFSTINLQTFFLYGALTSVMFLLPFDLIRVHGYAATAAGAALLPLSLVLGLFSGASGRLADRLGPRTQLIGGPMLAGVGMALLALGSPGASYWVAILPASLVFAVGMTLTVSPLTATVMGAVESRHAGLASGVNNAVARVAGLLAVAVLGLAVPAATADPADLHRAFQGVMLAAGACGVLSGVIAAVGLPSRIRQRKGT